MRGSAKKTHCKRGHAFTPANEKWFSRSDGSRHRTCLACALAHRPPLGSEADGIGGLDVRPNLRAAGIAWAAWVEGRIWTPTDDGTVDLARVE